MWPTITLAMHNIWTHLPQITVALRFGTAILAAEQATSALIRKLKQNRR